MSMQPFAVQFCTLQWRAQQKCLSGNRLLFHRKHSATLSYNFQTKHSGFLDTFWNYRHTCQNSVFHENSSGIKWIKETRLHIAGSFSPCYSFFQKVHCMGPGTPITPAQSALLKCYPCIPAWCWDNWGFCSLVICDCTQNLTLHQDPLSAMSYLNTRQSFPALWLLRGHGWPSSFHQPQLSTRDFRGDLWFWWAHLG